VPQEADVIAELAVFAGSAFLANGESRTTAGHSKDLSTANTGKMDPVLQQDKDLSVFA
jgi:hypothetical protein